MRTRERGRKTLMTHAAPYCDAAQWKPLATSAVTYLREQQRRVSLTHVERCAHRVLDTSTTVASGWGTDLRQSA